MNPLRKKRLESSIKKEMADLILRRRQKDDRLGLISISRVDLKADLSELHIWVSLFGDTSDNSRSWLALQDHCHFFQSSLGRNLRLRQTPHLSISIDESIREGDRVLEKMEEDRKTHPFREDASETGPASD